MIRFCLFGVGLQLLLLSNVSAEEWDVTVPRGQTRDISFDTTEVTGASVDMSPDREWLVFDLLAQIYRVPVGGGVAEVLTGDSGIAINFHPRYSPNGKEIVFISDRAGNNHIWIMNANGSEPEQITDDLSACLFDPTWTPDGQYIVARKQDVCHRGVHNANGLWIYAKDGSKERKLVGGRVSSPSVSPDGRHVYYHEGTCSGYIPGHNDFLKGCHQIRRVEMETGKIEPVTEGLTRWFWHKDSSGGAIAPRASPDGRWLAFARRSPNGTIDYRGHQFQRTALWVRNLHTGAERVIMDPVDLDEAEQMAYSSPLLPHYGWAPDSKSIVLGQGGKLRHLSLDTGEVRTIEFKAHVSRTISELARADVQAGLAPKNSTYVRWPTTASNGVGTVFQSLGKLWVQSAQNAQSYRLTDDQFTPLEYAPSWSPDGKWLAFSSWDDVDRGAIWKIPKGSGQPRRVTQLPGDYLNPIWSKDGKYIIAIKGGGATARGQRIDENNYFSIIRLGSDTGEELELARISPRKNLMTLQLSTTRDGRVHYLTESDVLAENPTEERLTEARSMSLNAGAPEVHGVIAEPEEYRVAPDGAHFVYTKHGQVYLAPFPRQSDIAEKQFGEINGSTSPITTSGGASVSWRNSHVFEYASGADIFAYDIRTKAVTRQRARVSVVPMYGKGAIALSHARILTMDRRFGNLEGTVVIRDGRIECVGNCDTSDVDELIDATNLIIMPGIVDTHAHFNKGHGGYSPRRNYLPAINLAYGITTAQDPSAFSSAVFSNAELIEAGEMIGPRTYSTGEPLYPWTSSYLDSYELVEREVLRRKAVGAVSLKSFILDRRTQRQWSAEAARAHGLNVTSEASYLPLNLSLIMDGYTGIEHGLTYNPIVYSDVLEFLIRAKTTVSMTVIEMGPGPMPMEYYPAEQALWADEKLGRWLPWREFIPLTRRSLKRPKSDYGFALYGEITNDIHAKGGNVSLGGHGDMQGLSTHWEIWSIAEGMDAFDVLEVATMGGARYIGIESDVGSIAPGKIADLIVLNSNPLENIRNTTDIKLVIKNGVVYEGMTLDQIWPEDEVYGRRSWVDEYALGTNSISYGIWDEKRSD